MGVREHLVRLSVESQTPIAHHEDAPAVFAQERDLLLDHDDGDAGELVDLAQRLEDERGARRVERRGGLVEHEHARGKREDGRDGHLLLLAARERGDLAVAQVLDAHGGKRLADALLDLVVRHAEVLEAKEYLVLDDGGHHLRVDVLQDAADHAADVGEGDLASVLAVHEGRAKELTREVVGDGAAHDGGERRLAGARRADDAHELALAHGEVDVVQSALGALPVGEGDVLQLDDCFFAAHAEPFSMRKKKRRPMGRRVTWYQEPTC